MGDIVELWRDIIARYSDELECGFCWRFYAPLTELKLNLVRDVLVEPGSDEVNEACCVHVFLIRNQPDDFSSTPNYSNFGNLNTVVHNENYTVYFLIKSKEGLNNYNEISDHPISEGRYNTIFKPIRECIDSRILTDICGDGQLASYRGSYVYDYQDEQYYGLRVNFSQRLTDYDATQRPVIPTDPDPDPDPEVWTPKADFDLWYDFSTPSGLTLSGSDIVGATDLTGNGYDATTDAGKRPKWAAGKINGLGAAVFNQSYLKFDSYASEQGGGRKRMTLFIVFRFNTVTNPQQYVFSFSNTGNDTPLRVPLIKAAGGSKYQAIFRDNGSLIKALTGTVDATTNYVIYRGQTVGIPFQSQEFYAQYNGANFAIPQGDTSIGGSTINAATIGALRRTSTTDYFKGEIAEVFFATEQVSGNVINKANLYLSNKYGINLTP